MRVVETLPPSPETPHKTPRFFLHKNRGRPPEISSPTNSPWKTLCVWLFARRIYWRTSRPRVGTQYHGLCCCWASGLWFLRQVLVSCQIDTGAGDIRKKTNLKYGHHPTNVVPLMQINYNGTCELVKFGILLGCPLSKTPWIIFREIPSDLQTHLRPIRGVVITST